MTEDGKKALITLANGDMRKVLNVLQVGSDTLNKCAIRYAPTCHISMFQHTMQVYSNTLSKYGPRYYESLHQHSEQLCPNVTAHM